MRLSVRCDCGKTYKVPDTAAGRKVRCKECGASIPVPMNKAAGNSCAANEEEDFINMDLHDSHDEESSAPPRSAGQTP